MKQKKLQTVAALVDAGNKASAGAAVHGAEMNLVVGCKALIDGDLNALTAAAKAHLHAFGELRRMRTALQRDKKAAYDLAFIVRDSLKRSLGRTYSSQWEGTGFTRSLKIPRSLAPLQQLLRLLKHYFTEQPEAEVPNVATAGMLGAALEALVASRGAVTVQQGKQRTLLAARRLAEKKMRLRFRGLAEELNRVVGPLDGRWESFGLNQPGIKQKPPVPQGITAVLAGSDHADVRWEPAPRAEYYRVWFRVKGAESGEFEAAGRPADPNFLLPHLSGGTEVEVAVSAVNNGGESALSEVKTLVVPVAPILEGST